MSRLYFETDPPEPRPISRQSDGDVDVGGDRIELEPVCPDASPLAENLRAAKGRSRRATTESRN